MHIMTKSNIAMFLPEIKEFYDVRNVIYCVIAGDLNTDLSRLQSRNTLHLTEFANEEDLEFCKLMKCSNISYTLGGSSCIEHFMISSNLVCFTTKYDVYFNINNVLDQYNYQYN